MRSHSRGSRIWTLWIGLQLIAASVALGQGDDRLVGIWALDEGFQITELLFRSDGRYQLDTKSTDSDLGFSSSERGHYEVNGQALVLAPYEFFGEPSGKRYEMQLSGDSLTLIQTEFDLTYIYQLKSGSRAEVLAREKVETSPVGTWGRNIQFAGRSEYTFRPDGHYVLKKISAGSQFPPEFIRGRYEQNGRQLTMKPYSGTEAPYEIDFFGNTLTLIRTSDVSGDSETYEEVPGSKAEVRAKTAEAEAFLRQENWQAGVWDLQDDVYQVELTIRPDGHYSATNSVEILRGTVRGRYTLEPGRIHLFPFIGQGLYSRDNGHYGKVERTLELDYYDGELQLIDLESISQWVTLARKRPGSDAEVLENVRQAQAERQRQDWSIGIWEVNDPNGWMEFTFRPDNRYIAKSGSGGVPSQVERGQYVVRGEKLTLAPYAGLGQARGFELDLYNGDLFLIGDLNRMVIARKIAGSETDVIEKTRNPEATQGERGSILGLWTANVPGQYSELIFRPDGQFRLSRCANNAKSYDYGLYAVDMATRTLISDSRFTPVQNLELDFYGNTMTIYGGIFGSPSTYTVNLGIVDMAIAASQAADAEEAQIDALWKTRVPIAPRDPKAVQMPVGDIPADPQPGRLFEAPTVFTGYHLYRRLTPGFVYFNEQGAIESVPVVNTREWHFFPTGRVLVRFKNYHAGVFYPSTVVEVSDSWGAYRIDPKPDQKDILHLYADNGLFLETDSGERAEMTLEDGRRNLFWGKDYQILSEWASEQKPIPCQAPAGTDPSLINFPVFLSTDIKPDDVGGSRLVLNSLARPVSGNFTLTGTTPAAADLIVEHTTSLSSPVVWQPLQTNSVPAGAFSLEVPQGANTTGFFRVRQP